MKTTFIPKLARHSILPIIAATTITSVVAVNDISNNDKNNVNRYENANWDTFKKADSNNDNVLNYDEYLTTRPKSKKQNGFYQVNTAEKSDWKRLGYMTLLAFGLALTGVIKDIKEEDKNKEQK